MRTLVVAVATVLSLAVAGAVRATTLPSVTVHVKVTLTGRSLVLSRPSAARGYTVEFAVRNGTAHRRTFSVGGKTIAVPAKRTRLTAVQFQARGRYAVVSRGPAPVLRGTFRVS